MHTRIEYIVKQYQPPCQGEHVETEYTFMGYKEGGEEIWRVTDNKQPDRPRVESMLQREGEAPHEFYARLSQRADEIDREYAYSRCYR